MYLAMPAEALATPAPSAIVRPAIQNRQGVPRVPFFTGDIRWDNEPRILVRKPRQARVQGQSAWVVTCWGQHLALTDPCEVRGVTVFNTAKLTADDKRTIIIDFTMPENRIVNGFEIKELPNGYVDCLSWCGTVMATFSDIHDAVLWSLSEETPTLDDTAKRELARLDEVYGEAA